MKKGPGSILFDAVTKNGNIPATNALQAFLDSKDNLALADINTDDFSADRKTAKERDGVVFADNPTEIIVVTAKAYYHT